MKTKNKKGTTKKRKNESASLCFDKESTFIHYNGINSSKDIKQKNIK